MVDRPGERCARGASPRRRSGHADQSPALAFHTVANALTARRVAGLKQRLMVQESLEVLGERLGVGVAICGCQSQASSRRSLRVMAESQG